MAKGPLLATMGFCRRVEGGEVQKVHFLGPKGPLLGVPHLPRFDPGYGPAWPFPMGLHRNRIQSVLCFGSVRAQLRHQQPDYYWPIIHDILPLTEWSLN